MNDDFLVRWGIVPLEYRKELKIDKINDVKVEGNTVTIKNVIINYLTSIEITLKNGSFVNINGEDFELNTATNIIEPIETLNTSSFNKKVIKDIEITCNGTNIEIPNCVISYSNHLGFLPNKVMDSLKLGEVLIDSNKGYLYYNKFGEIEELNKFSEIFTENMFPTINDSNIGNTENYWSNGFIFNISSNKLLPIDDSTSIGATDSFWDNAYITNIESEYIIPKNNSSILGNIDNKWKDIFVESINGKVTDDLVSKYDIIHTALIYDEDDKEEINDNKILYTVIDGDEQYIYFNKRLFENNGYCNTEIYKIFVNGVTYSYEHAIKANSVIPTEDENGLIKIDWDPTSFSIDVENDIIMLEVKYKLKKETN